ncbi:MAG: hypothetical protein AAGA73_00390 [Pseudomonadota bacterium]
MTYPYSVMRTLAGPMASSMMAVYIARIQALESRTKRSLEAGVTPDRAEELQYLLNGCRAALGVLEETPKIIERWDKDQGAGDMSDDDGYDTAR